MPDTDPPRSSELPLGFDETDPYADEDPATYPDWWWENVEIFREHGLRPYHPPIFTDGELVPEVIARLEAELDLEIELRVRNPQDGNNWEMLVEGKTATTVAHTRRGDGRSVYHMTSDKFEILAREEATK